MVHTTKVKIKIFLIYLGHFNKDFFLKGKWVHKSGLFFEGVFYKDRFHKGKFYFSDGDIFEGEWSVTSKKYFLKSGVFHKREGSSIKCVPNKNLYVPSRILKNVDLTKYNLEKKKMKSLQDLEELKNQRINLLSPLSYTNQKLSLIHI